MDKFLIEGGVNLKGEIRVVGAKNAILPAMAAALLLKDKISFSDVPQIIDIKMMAHLMRIIGARVDHDNESLMIDGTNCSFYEAPYELVSKMRASIYVLGPLLARFGKALVSFPGGCAIGNRPVDLHLKAMERLGAKIDIRKGYIIAECDKLKGNDIVFDKSSVGATINTLMAAVTAKGRTRIFNAATEPEIEFIIDLLNQMGAKITGRNTTTLDIEGVEDLHSCTVPMIPDRIEAGTFLIAGAITNGDIIVKNCVPEHLRSLCEKLTEAGVELQIENDSIRVKGHPKIHSVNIMTNPYPSFPTDLQAQFMSLMSIADGASFIEENIFPDRFMHVAELNRLDANIHLEKNVAVVKGVNRLSGAEVMATDLRASAALVLAGLAAEGTTTISRIYHIDRGYYQIEKKLQAVGARIERVLG